MTKVDLEENEIFDFIKENANTIEINKIKIEVKSLKIGQLKEITHITISGSPLKTIPSSISKLVNLNVLSWVNSKLENIPKSIEKLDNLEILFLSNNQIKIFPKFTTKLKNLSSLVLSNNKLGYLPDSFEKLEDLTLLDLSDNNLKLLPHSITELKYIHNVVGHNNWIENNPLENPPLEIAKKGINAIKTYFNELKEEQKANEIKVLVIGDGDAGKTSLINRVIFNTFDSEEKKTNGIVKNEYNFEDIKANFWDFGGQTIYHSTHQFFLSKRSFYILLLDGRKEQEEEYWLKMIENFGDDSQVFIVLNKMDNHKQARLDEKFLSNKYKNIKGFFKVSCKDGRGIEELKKSLEQEIKESDIIKEVLPKSWFNAKEYIEELDDDFLNYNEFQKICDKNDVGKDARNVLIGFLHDLGVILNFGNDFNLKDTHIINPDWATQGVYDIINSDELCENDGLLNLNNLGKILDNTKYPNDKHGYLIELMKKFELCFQKDGNHILIPELLEENEPPFEFDKKDAIKFRIQYDFLPKAVITRFIVNIHDIILDGLVWKKGVVLEDKSLNTKAIIREDRVEKRIDIVVFGNYKRELLSKIRATFEKINENFKKNSIVEKVLLPDNNDIKVDFEHLLFLEQENEPTFFPEGAKKRYPVSQLLDGFIKKDEREKLIVKNIYGDNYEKIEQKNETSGSIGGKDITHNNESKELLELIKLIDESELKDKDEIIEELQLNQNDNIEVQTILGKLMSRGAEVATLVPAILGAMQRILPV